MIDRIIFHDQTNYEPFFTLMESMTPYYIGIAKCTIISIEEIAKDNYKIYMCPSLYTRDEAESLSIELSKLDYVEIRLLDGTVIQPNKYFPDLKELPNFWISEEITDLRNYGDPNL